MTRDKKIIMLLSIIIVVLVLMFAGNRMMNQPKQATSEGTTVSAQSNTVKTPVVEAK